MSGQLETRCFSCGKVFTGKMWDAFEKVHDKEGKVQDQTLDKIGLTRMCCRRMFKGHPFKLNEMLARNPAKRDIETLHIDSDN